MPGEGIRHGEPTKFLPARLNDAGNEPLRSELTECETGDLEPPNEGAAPAADFATIDYPRGARVPGKLGETGIVLLGLELSAQGGILFDRSAFPLVTIDPGRFRHKERRTLADFRAFATPFWRRLGPRADSPGQSFLSSVLSRQKRTKKTLPGLALFGNA